VAQQADRHTRLLHCANVTKLWQPERRSGLDRRLQHMSSYKVVPGANSGFKIEIISDGIRQTMLGFDTEADALAWVDADQAKSRIYQPVSFDTERAFHPSDLGDD
jgi:hypothetical protein